MLFFFLGIMVELSVFWVEGVIYIIFEVDEGV